MGWNLPPGVTDRMIDEAAGGYDECDHNGWDFDKHGPRCPKCGEVIEEFAVVRKELAQPWPEIVTHCIFPPISVRQFDWCAYLDGQEERLCGYGSTEAEAVADLNQLVEDGF